MNIKQIIDQILIITTKMNLILKQNILILLSNYDSTIKYVWQLFFKNKLFILFTWKYKIILNFISNIVHQLTSKKVKKNK